MKITEKALSLLILSTFIFWLSCSKADSSNEPDPQDQDSTHIDGYTLMWHDEFDAPGVPDENIWGYDIGGHGWGNNELQYYTDDSVNVRIENGKMIIEAHYYENADIEYTSARLVTREKQDWLYGRVEVKAKLPYGRGTWPAIWMLPTDWEYGGWPESGEIDIMEHVGYDPNIIHGTVHTEAYNHSIGTQVGAQINIPTAITDYHVYAIEWEAEKIDFYVDEQLYFTFNNEGTGSDVWPFNKRFHLILNIAIGGNWGGAYGVDNTVFPVQMDIDYVRVYSKD